MLVPVLLALSLTLTLFSFRSSAQAPKADKPSQPLISVVFNMHLDPVPGPSPAMRRAESNGAATTCCGCKTGSNQSTPQSARA